MAARADRRDAGATLQKLSDAGTPESRITDRHPLTRPWFDRQSLAVEKRARDASDEEIVRLRQRGR